MAWALSTLMRNEGIGPSRHKVEAFRRIARAELGRNRKHLLARCVEYYLQLDAREQKEFQDMLAERENQDVRSFEDHWLNRMERAAERRGHRKGVREGVQQGVQQGLQRGRQQGRQDGMRQLLLGLLERRFGSVPETVRQRVLTLESTEELTRLASRVSTVDSLAELDLGD